MLVSQVRVAASICPLRGWATARESLEFAQKHADAFNTSFPIELGGQGTRDGDYDTDESLAYTKQELEAVAKLLHTLKEAKHPPRATLIFYFSHVGPRMQDLLANCETLPHLRMIICESVLKGGHGHNPHIELRGSADTIRIVDSSDGPYQARGSGIALSAFEAIRTGALVAHERTVEIAIKRWTRDSYAAAWAMAGSGRVDELRIEEWDDYKGTKLEETSSPFIAAALSTPYVARLMLTWGGPGRSMCQHLINTLRTTTTLRELTLCETRYYARESGRAMDVADLIKDNKCSFTTLKLYNMDLNAMGVKPLIDALCKNTHITELDLSQPLTSRQELHEFYRGLTEALRQNRTLRSINLWHNFHKVVHSTDRIYEVMDVLNRTNQGIYALRTSLFILDFDCVKKFVDMLHMNDQIIDFGAVVHGDKRGRVAAVDAIIDRNRRIRTLAAASAISICTRRESRENPLRGALTQLIPVILGLDEHFVRPSAARVARAREERRKEQKETQLVESKKVES